MLKSERKKQSILFTLGILPVCSTDQLARIFPYLKYPSKEASKLLKELEREKMVEGYERKIGLSKLWRLTRKAKKMLDIQKKSIPLTIRNIEHYLKIADAYFDLVESGGLSHFVIELREEFVNTLGIKRKYCPDAFLVFEGVLYFLEVQRSYLSRINWGEKWKIANEFFHENHLYQSSVAEYVTSPTKPEIIVITQQKEGVVQTGAKIDLLVFSCMKDFCDKIKKNE